MFKNPIHCTTNTEASGAYHIPSDTNMTSGFTFGDIQSPTLHYMLTFFKTEAVAFVINDNQLLTCMTVVLDAHNSPSTSSIVHSSVIHVIIFTTPTSYTHLLYMSSSSPPQHRTLTCYTCHHLHHPNHNTGLKSH